MDIAGRRKAPREAPSSPEASRELVDLAQFAEEIADGVSELADLAEDLAEIAEQAVRPSRIGARKGKLRFVRRISRDDWDW